MTPKELKYIVAELAFNDSQEALHTLYVQYREKIHRYIFLYVKSNEPTRELVSDVFVAVWENRKYIPEVVNLNAYIYKIAKFKALNYLRSQKMVLLDLNEMDIDLFAQSRRTPEDQLISDETVETINNAINQLPPRCKMAFKLVREDGMRYDEAAQLLEISVKTLESHLSNAIKKIRETLGVKKT